jgi:hypothetical protein
MSQMPSSIQHIRVVWKTIGKLLEKILEVEAPLHGIFVLFENRFIKFMWDHKNISELKFLKCVYFMAKCLSSGVSSEIV